MTDHGHELLFGTYLTSAARSANHVVDLAELTEKVGLDLVSVPDHPYWPGLEASATHVSPDGRPSACGQYRDDVDDTRPAVE